VIGVGAGAAGRDRQVHDAERGITAVTRAGVGVVEQGRGGRSTVSACVAQLVAIARVGVGAARARWDRRVLDGAVGRATVDGARTTVVDGCGRAWLAVAVGVAELLAVARVGVGAAGSGRRWGMADTGRCVTAIHGARIAVVERRRAPGLALGVRAAAFGAVAGVGVAAGRVDRNR